MDSLKTGTVDLEEDDVLNDETFGDAEEWEWEGDEEESNVNASKDSISRLMSSTVVSGGHLHSSNILGQLPGPNMSSIVTCSDLESDLSSLKIQDDDPAIKSCAPFKDTSFKDASFANSASEEQSQINLDDFDFSDPNDSSSKVKSVYFDNVWAPPDQSILKPSISTNPWNRTRSPVVPKDDPYTFPQLSSNSTQQVYKPVPSGNVMRLEDIEAGMLKESVKPSSDVRPIPQAQQLPSIVPVPVGKVKTLEEIEREMLEGSSSGEKPRKGEETVGQGTVTAGQGTVTAGQGAVTAGQGAVTAGQGTVTAAQGAMTGSSQSHTGPYSILQRPPAIPIHPVMMVPVGMRPMFAAVAAHQVPRGLPMPPRSLPMVPRGLPMVPHGYIIPPSLYPISLQRFEHQPGFRHQLQPHQLQPHQLPPHPYLQQQNMNLQRFQGHPMQQNARFLRRDRNEEVDEYAGMMSKKEQDWLINIQKMQLDNLVSDPYVDDFYNMCFNSRKLNNKSTAALLILESRGQNDAGNKKVSVTSTTVTSTTVKNTTPKSTTVKSTETTYSPFNTEGSLGKLQVSNAKCPRKLLDLIKLKESDSSDSEPGTLPALARKEFEPGALPALARKELTQLRKLLLDIERLYLVLMKIDYEDKRMAALPESSRGPHLETRKVLSSQLFNGITENRDEKVLDGNTENRDKDQGRKLNRKIASIRKGAALILRTLLILDDLNGKKLIASSLVKEVQDFPSLLLHKEYFALLLDSIEEIKTFDKVLADILRSKIEAHTGKSESK